jgi:NADH-quinone oxidoreductase subunit F/NADP-reducing hydrogenase subunit HndC
MVADGFEQGKQGILIGRMTMSRFTTRDEFSDYSRSLTSCGESAVRARVLVGMSTCGIASGARETLAALNEAVVDCGAEGIEVVKTGCVGLCHSEPIVEVEIPGKPLLTVGNVGVERARSLVKSLVQGSDILGVISTGGDIYHKQERIALRNCGRIDPESFEDYVKAGGYAVLAKALFEQSPSDVIEVIKASGLRGRGGGGFPTGLKWGFAQKSPGDVKYVVCNADEGDPGAFMDRSILEGDPHVIVESMAVAGYAIGAQNGFIYVRAEYPLAVERLERAIAQAKEHGLLGEKILGGDFSFDIKIKYGAGAFVCGEETSLIHSIEGKRGEPTVKPPFPAEAGLWGKPTNVNNVETLANVIPILEKGSDWFRSIGTEDSPGTKVFALAGDVKNVGLVEVPMGTTLREIVLEIGGGAPSGKQVKAVQTGGPSGGCIPAAKFDTPVDYATLTALGSIMGSGGLIVMDADTSMVEIARFYLQFTCDESCGKCTPCRVGNKRLLEILDRLLAGEAKPDDLDTLEELSLVIKDTALCGLGQTSPNPVLSTLKWYRDEYKQCLEPRRQHKLYSIDAEKCIGCHACAKVCPAECIEGKVKDVHVIDQTRCVHCGACFNTCKFDAIVCE